MSAESPIQIFVFIYQVIRSISKIFVISTNQLINTVHGEL